MPDLWMDVDAALAEVPVNVLPLCDDADFKTIEGAVAYNAAGMALRWHFVTTAGAYTVTSVTPTTSGDYDWTDQGDSGVYTIEIPASGGASINNDTEGFGWFTGVATGVLPWRGPIIGFRAAGLNDKMIDSAYSATRGLGGTALPDAAADAAGGLPISDAGGLDLDAKIGALTYGTANRVNVQVFGMENNVVTAAAVANGAIDAATFAADVDAEILSYIVDDATRIDASALNTATVTTVPAIVADTNELQTDWANGGRLDLLIDATLADTNELQTDWANGGRLDNILDARASQTSVDDIPTNAELATSQASADDATLAAIAALNNLSSAQAQTAAAAALTAYDPPTHTETTAAAVAAFTTAMTEAYAANGAAPTPAQALFAIHQMLMQFAIAGTSYTVKKLDNSTTAFVVTLDSATVPTSAVRT